MRAYRIPGSTGGSTVADVERSFAPARVFEQRVRRGGEVLEATSETVGAAPLGEAAGRGARADVVVSDRDIFI